ncbi:MAG: hypothetical protein ACLFVJ_22240, partial [Persicimonas sp.]
KMVWHRLSTLNQTVPIALWGLSVEFSSFLETLLAPVGGGRIVDAFGSCFWFLVFGSWFLNLAVSVDWQEAPP